MRLRRPRRRGTPVKITGLIRAVFEMRPYALFQLRRDLRLELDQAAVAASTP